MEFFNSWFYVVYNGPVSNIEKEARNLLNDNDITITILLQRNGNEVERVLAVLNKNVEIYGKVQIGFIDSEKYKLYKGETKLKIKDSEALKELKTVRKYYIKNPPKFN